MRQNARIACAITPLPDGVGRVTEGFHVVGHGLELQRQPTVLPRAPEAVLHACVEAVASAHEGGA